MYFIQFSAILASIGFSLLATAGGMTNLMQTPRHQTAPYSFGNKLNTSNQKKSSFWDEGGIRHASRDVIWQIQNSFALPILIAHPTLGP